MELRNRVALVTGAGKRVGREIALELARGGASVAIHYRNSKKEAEETAKEIGKLPAEVMLVKADLAVREEIVEMFRRIETGFGRLDILVNSAAVFRRTPYETISEDDFDFHMNANLKAPFLCSIHAARLMKKNGAGKIINITDIAAERVFKNYIPYCISKSGLAAMTKGLAKALAPEITVNAVAPGTILFRDDEDEAHRNEVTSAIPLKRIGSPADIAKTVRFLIEGSDFITGAIIPVDGGRRLR